MRSAGRPVGCRPLEIPACYIYEHVAATDESLLHSDVMFPPMCLDGDRGKRLRLAAVK